MDNIIPIISLLLMVIAMAIFLVFNSKKASAEKEMFKSELENQMLKMSQEVVKNAQDSFLLIAKEKLIADKQVMEKDLEGKKDQISGLIDEIRKDIKMQNDKLKESDNARLSTFSALKQELESYKQITADLKGSTDDLKRVLSNNQLRGQFGEQIADNLLKMAGFVIGQDYIFNKEQQHAETRPDFTIFLPDKTKINVDAKFPYSSLLKMSSTEDAQEKNQYLKQFAADIKQKIKQVTTRDYINPEDKTVDFVILFIPNEMIFSFIYDRLNDVWEEAMAKKVVMTGPFSFTAILRMIKQAYSNFRYQENLHHVIGLIQKFEIEFDKYNENLDKLGNNLQTAVKQYDTVSGTRTRMLNKIVDQIKNQNVLPNSQDLKIIENE